MSQVRRVLAAALLAAALGAGGAAQDAGARRAARTATRMATRAPVNSFTSLSPTLQRSYIADIVALTPARSAPGGPVVRRLATDTPTDNGPQQLLVVGSRRRSDGSLWLRVLLPYRPDGSTAWVDANLVQVHATPWWVSVDTATRHLDLYRAGRLVMSVAAVVGKPSTPTPKGLFAVYQVVPQSPANGFEGPWSLQLTALSNALRSFDGGPGRVAIHGRDGTSLLDPLGTARSHGCIRVADPVVDFLAAHLEPGVPVHIS